MIYVKNPVCAPRFCRMQLFWLRVVRRRVCAPSVKRGAGNITKISADYILNTCFYEPRGLMLSVRRCTHPSIHPPFLAVVLNALGHGRDLFSASLMHRFNGALILFSAPQGLLRSVMCASVVCSLPISRHISYLQSGSQMRFNAGKKRKKDRKRKKKMDVVADIVLSLFAQGANLSHAVCCEHHEHSEKGRYINAKLLNLVIKNQLMLPPPEQNVSENICMLKYATFKYFEF